MGYRRNFARSVRWPEIARRSAEYAIAIGIAALCGYAIVLWRW